MGVGALVALGQVERAKQWIPRTVLVDPDNSNMRYNLACALVELGDLEVGLDLLEPPLKPSEGSASSTRRLIRT